MFVDVNIGTSPVINQDSHTTSTFRFVCNLFIPVIPKKILKFVISKLEFCILPSSQVSHNSIIHESPYSHRNRQLALNSSILFTKDLTLPKVTDGTKGLNFLFLSWTRIPALFPLLLLLKHSFGIFPFRQFKGVHFLLNVATDYIHKQKLMNINEYITIIDEDKIVR